MAVVAPYDAVGTLSEFFCYIVALVDNELLVEDLEGVSRHPEEWHGGDVCVP